MQSVSETCHGNILYEYEYIYMNIASSTDEISKCKKHTILTIHNTVTYKTIVQHNMHTTT